jgi:regulatory protein
VSSEIDRARLFAYKLLNYRPRAERELQRRLEHKGYSKEVAESTVNTLKRLGYIEDRAFARYWVKVRFCKKGIFGIRQELLEKGIDIIIANEALAELGPDDEYSCALKLAKKKIKLSGGICPYPRLAGFLGRRGFSNEVIYKVCQALVSSEL